MNPSLPSFALLAAFGVLLVLAGACQAQTRTTGAGNGFNSSGISISGPDPKFPPRQVKVIRIVALTPERPWKSADNRVITASLVAHDRPESENGKPPVVVANGIVRLLKDEKVFDVKLETLSLEDRNYIEELVYAIQEAEERKAAAAAAAADQEKTPTGEKKE